ncbi:MAG: hypothetical protein ACLFMZ_12340 [Spirochaetaceae bacterium]
MDQVIKRLVSGFGLEEVLACFGDSPFMLNLESGRPEKLSGKAEELWNTFFELVYAHGGSRWLSLIEPLIQQFETRYGVSRPRIYLGELAKEKRRTLGLQEEKEKLERGNENFRSNLELTREEMTKDQVTGLYNEDFLVRYLLNIFNESTWDDFYRLLYQNRRYEADKRHGYRQGKRRKSGQLECGDKHRVEGFYLYDRFGLPPGARCPP